MCDWVSDLFSTFYKVIGLQVDDYFYVNNNVVYPQMHWHKANNLWHIHKFFVKGE